MDKGKDNVILVDKLNDTTESLSTLIEIAFCKIS